MQITWYGHASFGIESRAGLRIVTDPYDPTTSGYKPYPDPADLVIMSSDNDDFHCNGALVPKRTGARVVNALEVAQSGGRISSHDTDILAIEAMEHLQHDRHDPEQNAMYRFAVDGIELGHMGDIGNPLTDNQVEFLRGVNVLLALAGGFPVIELAELRRIVDLVRPQIVIPMHFRTLCFKLQTMHWITEFLRHFPDDDTDFACSPAVTLTRESLPKRTRALVLDYL